MGCIRITPLRSFMGSVALIISFLVAGCSPREHQISSRPSAVGAFSSAQELVEKFGYLTSPEIDRYLFRVASRVRGSFPAPRIVVLNTHQSIATTPGNNYILLSVGLLRELSNEAELAFVLAHEISHLLLAHHTRVTGYKARDTDLELEADALAVNSLVQGAYHPLAARAAIEKAYGNLEFPNHGEVQERVTKIDSLTGGGIVRGELNARDYQYFLSLLPQRSHHTRCCP